MVVSTHQPLFLPWPGLFFKAIRADCLVLLDNVQFPTGRSWVSRNRFKSAQGAFWLTVPIHRKGLGLQRVGEVRVFSQTGWRCKHLKSIEHHYAKAPYIDRFFPEIRSIYDRNHSRLAELNLELIHLLWSIITPNRSLILQSELGVAGRGTDLIVNICNRLNAETYVAFPMAAKYLDQALLETAGIQLKKIPYRAPVYPQLWGDFIPNLSALDFVLNCGPASSDILSRS